MRTTLLKIASPLLLVSALLVGLGDDALLSYQQVSAEARGVASAKSSADEGDSLSEPRPNANLSFLNEQAGFAVYAKARGNIDLHQTRRAFHVVIDETPTHIGGTVALDGLPGHAPLREAFVYVTQEGWALAYLHEDQPTAAAFWIMGGRLTNLLEDALQQVLNTAGATAGTFSYFDFRFPSADRFLLAGGDVVLDWKEPTAISTSYGRPASNLPTSRMDIMVPSEVALHEMSFRFAAAAWGACSVHDGGIDYGGRRITGSHRVPDSASGRVQPPALLPGSRLPSAYVLSVGKVSLGAVSRDRFQTITAGDCDRDGNTNFLEVGGFEVVATYRATEGKQVVARNTRETRYLDLERPQFVPAAVVRHDEPTTGPQANAEQPPAYVEATPQQAGDPSVYLHGTKTEIELGDAVLLDFSIVSSMARPALRAQLILQVPSGWNLSGAGFADGCTGQCNAVYELNPGDNRSIQIALTPNQEGSYAIMGRVEWLFPEETREAEPEVQMREARIPVVVRAQATPTPAPASERTSVPTTALGEVLEPEAWPGVIGAVLVGLAVLMGFIVIGRWLRS